MRTRLLVVSALLTGALFQPAAAPAATAPRAPSVTTGAAASITFSGATLTGKVNPNGSETNYYFQYGPTAAYGQTTPLTPLGHGTSTASVSAPVSGLQPAARYHFRLVALGAGTSHGSDRSFTTAPIPLTLSLGSSPNPVSNGGFFSVLGTLSGTGNGNRPVILQANPFPYTAGFSNVGNPELTHPDGTFLFANERIAQNTQLRVVSIGAPTVTSQTITEGVLVQVSLRSHRTRRRHVVRFTGSVSPAEVGAQVSFQRLLPRGGYVTVGSTSVRAGSTFSRRLRVRRGVYRVYVVVNDGGHLPNYSPGIFIR